MRIDGSVEREKDAAMVMMDEDARRATTVTRGRMLVVADDQSLGDVLAEMLREMGYSAATSPPSSAQGRARALQPALVVLAVVASDALVSSVRHSLRADPWTAAIPVVAVLPPSVRSPRPESVLAGAYLAMPFDLDDFVCCIDQVHPRHGRQVAPAVPTGYPHLGSIQGAR